MQTSLTSPSLIEQIATTSQLYQAWNKAYVNHGAPGSDHVSVDDYASKIEENLSLLQLQLINRIYKPDPVFHFNVVKQDESVRRLSISTVNDRIVQQLILNYIEPLFEPTFQNCSFAYRKGKSAQKAIHQIEQDLKKGFTYFVRSDISDFFGSINHDILFDLLHDKITDDNLRNLIHLIMSSDEENASKGISQGNILSPLFSNIYLNPFDTEMTNERLRFYRYSDDLLVLENSEKNLNQILQAQKDFLASLGLNLKEEKTSIGSLEGRFTYLGFEFGEFGKRPSENSMIAFFEKMESETRQLEQNSAHSPMIDRIKSIWVGWKGYFNLPDLQIDELLDWLEDKKSEYKKSIPYFIVMACLSVQLKKTEKAKEYLHNATDLVPNEFQYLFELGVIAIHLGENGLALELMNKARFLYPENRDCLFYLGLLEFERKHYDKAIPFLQRSIQIDNEFKEGQQLFSHICELLGLNGLAGKKMSPQVIPSKHSMETSTLILELFDGRENVYGKEFIDSSNRIGFLPVRKLLSNEEIEKHLNLEQSIAVYLIKNDNSVKFAAIDIDAKYAFSADQIKHDASTKHALEVALQIRKLCERNCTPCYLEQTGGKGYHLWYFFENPIPAFKAKEMLTAIVKNVSINRDFVNVEIFPMQGQISEEALGSMIRLPLGKSKLSGKSSEFLDDFNQPVSREKLPYFLQQIRKISFLEIERSFNNKPSVGPRINYTFSPEMLILIDKCHVLKSLVQQAEKEHELRHIERLVLLYSIGGLGTEGHNALHFILSQCSNYSEYMTQKWVNRLEKTKNPISCNKIRDWLSYLSPVANCDCQFKLKGTQYPTPLRFIWEYYLKAKEIVEADNQEIQQEFIGPEEIVTKEPLIQEPDLVTDDLDSIIRHLITAKKQIIDLQTSQNLYKVELLKKYAGQKEIKTSLGIIRIDEDRIWLEL
jgi:group II intron reverse transcriptase/maturase